MFLEISIDEFAFVLFIIFVVGYFIGYTIGKKNIQPVQFVVRDNIYHGEEEFEAMITGIVEDATDIAIVNERLADIGLENADSMSSEEIREAIDIAREEGMLLSMEELREELGEEE